MRKETDRRWEQGEDLSLVEFKTVEYEGSKQIVASDEIKQQILEIGIRKLGRDTRVSHNTLEKILKGGSVRRKTLAKIVKATLHSLRSVSAGSCSEAWRAGRAMASSAGATRTKAEHTKTGIEVECTP